MAMTFEQWCAAKKIDTAKVGEKGLAAIRAAYEAGQADGKTDVSSPADIKAQLKAWHDAGEIKAACKDHPEILKEALTDAGEIKSGWDVGRARQAIELKELREGRATGPFLPTGGDKDIRASACIEAAMCLKAGIPEARVGKWFDQKTMNEAVGQRYRGASIGSLMHACIQAAGLHADPGSITDDTIRTAHRADRRLRSGQIPPIAASAGFTSLSLSGVLSNLANKAMVAAYESQEVVWPLFAAIRNHRDFKVHTRYRLDMTGSLRKVGRDGELKHVGMSETSFTNQLDTYGAYVVLSRQMQIDDDLGAFLDMPSKLGVLARMRPEEALMVLLLANASNFFHANNKNLVSGAGGVLTAANAIAAIAAAEEKFSNQVSSNNKPIMVSPNRMLCGTGNYVVARNVYEGQLKISGKDQVEVNKNEHAGKYQPYKSAFVNNTAVKDEDGAAITGQSSTKWWLFADPARLAAFGMAFLNGQQLPTIESDDTEFTTLGMQWRCYMDFGVGYEDPAGAVQVNGA